MRIGLKSSLVTTGVLCLVMSTCAKSWAVLLSGDSFSATEYAVGTELPGLNPTIPGYTDAWTDIDFGDAEAAVASGSLVYGGAGYAAGSGNKIGKAADIVGISAATSGRTFRLLSSSLAATSTTAGTRYLSWLFQTGNENAADNADTYQTLALYNTNTGDGNRTFDAGISSADFATPDYGFRVNNNAATRSGLGVARNTDVHLFVAKFALSATDLSDSATVWLDPTLGGVGDPAGGVTFSGLNLLFDRLAISDYASNSAYYDEIRWGDTFASVTTEAFLPCDVNGNGVCNSTDFAIIRDNMLTSGGRTLGDLSGDGFIDFTDYRLFKDNPSRVIGVDAGSAGLAAVPEPVSLSLVGIASLFLCGCCRQAFCHRAAV